MILNEPFNKEALNGFLEDFLPDYQLDERSVRTPDKSILTEVTQLGISRKAEVTVLEAECEETDTNRRIAITQAAFKVLRDHSIRNAIIAFHDGADQWRLSLLTSTLEIKNGKVVKKDSNPRRYSYLLGVGAKTVTPYKYLVEKGKVEDIKQLQERFSVEVVNKQFYASVADLFTKLVGGERGATKYPGLLKINSVISQNVEHQEFAVRLIGRVIFSWFLKEKKSANDVSLVPEEILSSASVKQCGGNYYHDLLEALFFGLLNTRVNDRKIESLQQSPFNTVPYLNGGLFSDQPDDHYTQNSLTGGGSYGIVNIPNQWFIELFTVLEQYNFTVDENTSYVVDLSIDPEMLGRIFENLLAEINPETGESARKSTGSFYTPREIVDYMVDSSLLEFLKNKTDADEVKLKALISWGQSDDEEHPLTAEEKAKVVTALAGLTILDPACGSGAYPIGILQKVVYILQQVDQDSKLWLKDQLAGVSSPELRRDIERRYADENYDYLRKLGVIRQSIFGVDIQPIAIEIAKLRCFLTVIIEEQVDDNDPSGNRGVEPLPNLDFKFVTANTLINLPGADSSQTMLLEDTSDIDQLRHIRDEYFTASATTRAELKNGFSSLQKRMIISTYRQFTGNASKRYMALSEWEPFEHGMTPWFDSEWMFGIDKFDIVIGNPPYVQLQKNGGALANMYQDQGYQTFARTGDIYSLFYERGLELTHSKTGLLCYITSNKWMRAGYGEKTRAYFASKNPIKLIDFGGFKVFESATVDTNILLIQNATNQQNLEASHFKNDYKKDDEIASYFESTKSTLAGLSGKTWFIGSGAEQSLKAKIEQVGTPLKDWDVNIYRGVLTGCNEAFIIDEATKDRLIAEDAKSADIIKPVLRGRDIKRYDVDFQNLYILATGYDTDIQTLYPAVYRYIKSVGDDIDSGAIKVKGKGVFKRDDQGKNWWNLRHCNYYDEFEKEKIVYPVITASACFYYDTYGYFTNDKAFMIAGDNLKYLVGFLNSSISHKYMKMIGSPLGENGVEYRKIYLDEYPIPKITPTNQHLADELTTLVTQIQSTVGESEKSTLSDQIDQLVYQLYNLTPKEIAIVESLASGS